jgi:hypothetical protein
MHHRVEAIPGEDTVKSAAIGKILYDELCPGGYRGSMPAA